MFTAIKEEHYTAKKTNFSFRAVLFWRAKRSFPEVFTTAIVFPSSLGQLVTTVDQGRAGRELN